MLAKASLSSLQCKGCCRGNDAVAERLNVFLHPSMFLIEGLGKEQPQDPSLKGSAKGSVSHPHGKG